VAEGGGWGEEFRHARAEAKRFRRLGIKTSKQNNFQFLLRKIWRAGVKKLKENCFALLAEVRRAETRSGANQAFFVQKRFELRSVIATNLNFFQNQRQLVARSPRLRRVSLRKKPCISELNRKVGQIQIQFFGKANGGSFQFFPPMILFRKNHWTKQVFRRGERFLSNPAKVQSSCFPFAQNLEEKIKETKTKLDKLVNAFLVQQTCRITRCTIM